MNAITIPRSGGPEVLTWQTVPDPEPAAGEVLVDVTASAVNRADLMQRQGFYPPPPGAPPYPGLECSGRIAALGDGVTGWQVGDEVCALLAGGGYATRVAVPAGQVLPKPAAVSLRDAAALPEVACTVWSNVGQLAHLGKGETFLVHGGASGIGTHAIQLAKALGARVLCTAGSRSQMVRSLVHQMASVPRSPVRTRTTVSTGLTQTLPSPILPVRAAWTMTSTTLSTAVSSTRTSTRTFGTKSTEYSAPRYTSVWPFCRP